MLYCFGTWAAQRCYFPLSWGNHTADVQSISQLGTDTFPWPLAGIYIPSWLSLHWIQNSTRKVPSLDFKISSDKAALVPQVNYSNGWLPSLISYLHLSGLASNHKALLQVFMLGDRACCCQDDTFQIKNGLLYCKPMLLALLSSSSWEEAAVELQSGWSVWVRAVVESAWHGVCVQAGLSQELWLNNWCCLELGFTWWAAQQDKKLLLKAPSSPHPVLTASSCCFPRISSGDQMASDQSSHCSNWILTPFPKDKKCGSWISLPCWPETLLMKSSVTPGLRNVVRDHLFQQQDWMPEGIPYLVPAFLCLDKQAVWLHKSSQLALLLKEAVVPGCCHLCWFSAVVCCETTRAPPPPEEKGQRMELL